MSNTEYLTLRQAIDLLADQIDPAAYLLELGVRGTPSDCARCVLAAYLVQVTGASSVRVYPCTRRDESGWVSTGTDPGGEVADLPPRLNALAMDFDCGRLPALVAAT